MELKKDYYEMLEVSRDADAATIKRAFLRKARELHPDVSDDPAAEERFKEVNHAYSVLSDETARANYDRFGDENGPGGFGSDFVDMSDIFGGGFGINDIFDSFFGGGGSSSARQQRTAGRDMGLRLSITLAEAAAGCTKTVSYERLAPCEDCHGSGLGEGGHERSCGRCGGTGRVVEVQRTIFGQMQSQAACPSCHGSGKLVEKPCQTCQGQGRVPVREKVDVEIPAGIHSGQTVRIEGRGEAGVRGDRGGDLVVSVEVEADDRFERQGDDLFCVIEVDALEAIVGTTVTVEGILEGEQVSVEVPAGSQNGSRVEVPGRGMPRMNMASRGALTCIVRVQVPTDLTKAQLLQVASLVAERKADMTAPEDLGGAGESHAGGQGGKHFAEGNWRAPRDPFEEKGRARRGQKKSGRQAGRKGGGR